MMMMMMTKNPVRAVGACGPPTDPATAAPVLVIDDDAAGYPTATVANADAVLRLVRAEVMRLVGSELDIPCTEGACVVTALEQDRTRLPRLRVLVHTRHTTPADDARALATGCDGVLPRPGGADALAREVRRLEARDAWEPWAAASDDRSRP